MNKLKIKLISLVLLPIYFLSSSVIPVFAAVTYLYDANGNMTSDGTNCYTYNDSNQLSKVTNCSSGQIIAQYVYDYQGNRIEKQIYNNGTLQKTVYSPNDGYETVKLASNGATQNTTYYQVNDETLAKKNPDGSKNYYLNDNLGSTNVLTNQSGAIAEKTTYYPYGQIRTGGTKSKFQYTGQETDAETGLYYYNSRYYSSQIGRFIQPDTMIANFYDPQTLNRYSYVKNNPLRYTDPTGHFSLSSIFSSVTNVIKNAYNSVTTFITTLLNGKNNQPPQNKNNNNNQNTQPKQSNQNGGNTSGNSSKGSGAVQGVSAKSNASTNSSAAIDTITTTLLQHGYADIGASWSFGDMPIGTGIGIQLSKKGYVVYCSAGAMSPGFGGSFQYSADDISGNSDTVAASGSIFGGAAGSVSYPAVNDIVPITSGALEGGISTPGFSLMLNHSFPVHSWNDSSWFSFVQQSY